jgi:peptidyl-dipeptidase Dcp
MRIIHLMTASVAALSLAACASAPEPAKPAAIDTAAIARASGADLSTNAFLKAWGGPYAGVPSFGSMPLADLKPALEAGMAIQLAEIEQIANNPERPTFENTIAALEDAGRDLSNVFAYYGILSGNMSTPEFRAIQQEMAPKLSEFDSRITQNEKLFARVAAVYNDPKLKKRPAAEQRLALLVYEGFARDGATLDAEKKARYAEIDKRLAELHTQFGNNVLHDEESYVTYLKKTELGGLSESFIASAAAAAEERGRKGEYAITNTRSSMDPFLTYSTKRKLREKVWRTYYDRGDNGDEFDNNAIIAEILKLRDERVGLLGYDNYAAWRLENRMAKTPERALELMEAVWPAAVARAKEEVADMQQVADAEGARIRIAPWDYRFYAEKVRKAKYDLNSDEVKQYLELGKLREAMFYVAGELFGFAFAPVPEGSVPVWHEDVKVWEVTNKTTGAHVGLWYLDPFARPGKRSGAWASGFRGHETFAEDRKPLATNNSNFVEGPPGEPVLISWDDASTYFHEFGHALHSLSSNVAYPTLNGGVRDYTEFQSQLLERWLPTDPVIKNYLVHYKTGEPMPADLVAKIKAAANFNQGFDTTEYLASAIVDMKLHMADPEGIDPDAFERDTLAALGMPEEIVMRHRTPHFGHIFSGEGYSAGYYGYMWADVLTADAAEAFEKAPGGYYDPALAKSLVDNLFAPRNAVDPVDAYRAFRGRDAEIGALMRDRGFPEPGQ